MNFDFAVMTAVQSLSALGQGFMDLFFAACTFLGEETFLVLLVTAIYWCGNKALGENLLLCVYTAISANGLLKDLVRRPRPFLNPEYASLRYVRLEGPLVNTAGLGSSFSFPSGHSQCAGSIFTALALWRKKRGMTVLCGTAILLVMASRVYLGVHYPTDTLMGAALGIGASLVVWAFLGRFGEQKLRLFGAVVALSYLALLVSPTPDTVKTIGLGTGAFLGMALEQRFIRFSVEGTLPRRALRLLLGALLILAVRTGLKLLFPTHLFFDALRYGCIGLAATALWPWLFTRAKL